VQAFILRRILLHCKHRPAHFANAEKKARGAERRVLHSGPTSGAAPGATSVKFQPGV
jgi:hypothetical protein